jgi:putative ABC transport system permease protein
VVFVDTLLALGLVELLRKPFNEASGKELPFEILLTPYYLFTLFLFVIVLGILSGSYPAFFLSSFKPVQVLKGKVRAGFRSSNLRNVLVTLQFVISIVLITCTLVVQHQLNFMRAKKLGFDKENILIIDNAHMLASQQGFINSLQSMPAVQGAAAARNMPVDDYDGIPATTEEGREDKKLLNMSSVDHDFLLLLKYEFVAGRNFSKDIAADSDAVILNERAATFLFGDKAEGKKMYYDGTDPYTVIGVVKDFNFESLKNEVRPLVFFLSPDERYLHVRLNPGDYTEAIAAIQSLWKKQNADIPFSYSFLDEEYNNLFKEEAKLGTLFSIFTGLAIFIACLGLMGLAAYMAEQRKKEFSVRKVLGATVSQVVLLMSREYASIMIVSLVLALPIAYYTMIRWLDAFAYKDDISMLTLIGGGVLAIVIALLTVSYQAIRAALLNPVDSLKEE